MDGKWEEGRSDSLSWRVIAPGGRTDSMEAVDKGRRPFEAGWFEGWDVECQYGGEVTVGETVSWLEEEVVEATSSPSSSSSNRGLRRGGAWPLVATDMFASDSDLLLSSIAACAGSCCAWARCSFSDAM